MSPDEVMRESLPWNAWPNAMTSLPFSSTILASGSCPMLAWYRSRNPRLAHGVWSTPAGRRPANGSTGGPRSSTDPYNRTSSGRVVTWSSWRPAARMLIL